MPDEEDTLIDGYRRFRAEVWPQERARYEALAHWGQSPETMVVACSDSRVDPQMIFGAVPGELFVVRNVAGLVPPYAPDAKAHGTSAALEFGVKVLRVRRLVALGHAQCGGVKAIALGAPATARDFIASWADVAQPAMQAAKAAGETSPSAIEAEVLRLSRDNMLTFPWIKSRVDSGNCASRLIISTFTTENCQNLAKRAWNPSAEPHLETRVSRQGGRLFALAGDTW